MGLIVPWTKEETDFLKSNYPKLSIEELSKRLNRTVNAITHRVYKLKIVIPQILPPNNPGDRFGKLILLEDVGFIKKFGRKWLCLCDCGNKKEIRQHSLRIGTTVSCGCYNLSIFKERTIKPPGHASYNYLYDSYRGGARKRSKNRILVFELTFDQFKNIITQNCFFCKREPREYNPYLKAGMKSRSNFKVSEEGIKRATIFVNGIDRLNNSIGYTIENSVPCCTPCNRAKLAMTKEEFIDMCRRVSDNFSGESSV